MALDLDFSDDFFVIDNLETLFWRPSRRSDDEENNGTPGYTMDFDSGKMSTLSAEGGNTLGDTIELKDQCLFRLVTNRDQAVVKQVFQRGVALASLDFSIVDVLVEVYGDPNTCELPGIRLEDVIIEPDSGGEYAVVAIDHSKMTGRLRVACRQNK